MHERIKVLRVLINVKIKPTPLITAVLHPHGLGASEQEDASGRHHVMPPLLAWRAPGLGASCAAVSTLSVGGAWCLSRSSRAGQRLSVSLPPRSAVGRIKDVNNGQNASCGRPDRRRRRITPACTVRRCLEVKSSISDARLALLASRLTASWRLGQL